MTTRARPAPAAPAARTGRAREPAQATPARASGLTAMSERENGAENCVAPYRKVSLPALMPTATQMSRVDVAWKPRSAKSFAATSRISARRSGVRAAVLGAAVVMCVS